MQSFEFASKQLPDPLGQEIRRMLRESTLGMAAEQALAALGERLQSSDLDMVLTAINVQRAVGGNLAEILDNVAFTMRERERIRRKARRWADRGAPGLGGWPHRALPPARRRGLVPGEYGSVP